MFDTRHIDPFWKGLQSCEPYRPAADWLLESPYHRPTDLSALPVETLDEPLRPDTLLTQRSLVLNRLLFNIYQQNNLYLPEGGFSDADTRAFQGFYAPQFVAANALVRPALDRTCFDFLSREISVDGPWTIEHLEEYCTRLLADYEATPSDLCLRIEASPHPQQAARAYLVQLAVDFLAEASQMALALPGNYGPAQSEMMKIFIDEFGYGVHQKKHSTLFVKTIESVGLSARMHTYYYWYLPSSLLLTNYFFWTTVHKPSWFESLGGLYWAEAVNPYFHRRFGQLLKKVFGREKTDTGYFDEHAGIDLHHRRMAFDKLMRPMVRQYGDAVIPAMVRGIETYRLLGDLTERDFLAQMDFCDALLTGGAAASGPVDLSLAEERPRGFLLEPRVCDVDTVVAVARGEVEVDAGYLQPRRLGAGEAVRVPAGRMVGARVVSEGARLSVAPERPVGRG